MENINVYTSKLTVLLSGVVAFLEYLFGTHWILFAAFLLLNIADYVTGCLKSRLNGKSNSVKGAKGALKKLGYWIMIAVAFGMTVIFEEIGQIIGADLSITSMIGWFVLATLIINEIRSICENFVECGYKIPSSIIKGLEVANKAIDGTIATNGTLQLNIDEKEMQNRKKITLEVKDPNVKK